MDCEAVLIQNISEPLWNRFSVELKLKKTINSYRPVFIYESNICEFLGKTARETPNLFAIWIQNVLRYSNLPKSCPILANTYSWHNFRIEKNSLPPVVLVGYYRVNFTNFLKTNNGRLTINNSTIILIIKMK
ncbi:uncharacterized protein LOC105261774 [Musca domestica]|uniref:Uncharacterized protein LOC105261774 n=1 Tax=Musca domestica TaxID=7370 RepID=A0A1I8NKL8_MUSDO|nr:uncharacterized protein LOC105261774 [Musca domestica]